MPGLFTRLLLVSCVCCSTSALAESLSITDTAERFNPDSPVEGSGWAQVYDPGSNELLLLPYNKIDGMAIYQGDIVLGDAAQFDTRQTATAPEQQRIAIRSIRRRWIDAVVPYIIDSSFSSSQNARIRDAMAHIEARTSARFVQRSGQTDYVNILKTGGCSSFIGRQGGTQSLNLGGNCANSLGVIAHELYHALGMFHEQSRSDRDNFVTINFANIQSGFENNFEKASNALDVEIGPYDYDSIMHYGRFTFSRNGLETISVPNNQSIGNRNNLSEGDIDAMQYIYYTDLILDINAPARANPGADVAVTLEISNQGDGDIGNIIAKDVKLTLPLPGNSGYRGFSSSEAWQCELRGRTLECSLEWLNRASSTRLVVDLTTASDRNSMQLSPAVSASNRDLRTGNNQSSANIIVNTDADLAVTATVSKSAVVVGEKVEVELGFTNNGSVDTGQVNLSLETPEELAFESFSGSGWTCSGTRGTTGCQLANLAAAATSDLTIGYIAKSVVANADIEATVTIQATDGNTANNQAKTALRITQPATDSNTSNSDDSSSSSAGAIDLLALLSLYLLGLGRHWKRRLSRARWPLGKIACLPVIIWLGGCQVSGGEATRTLYVDSKMVACTGMMPRQCLRVKHSAHGEWEYFYSDIIGFEFEPGYRYTLSVVTRELDNPPQDVSSTEYQLIEVLDKSCAGCE